MRASFFVVAYRFGFAFITIELIVFSYMAFVAACVDVKHMILPDTFTLGGCAIGLVGPPSTPNVVFTMRWRASSSAFFHDPYVGYLIYKQEVLGGGDIKLLAWIGAVLGAFHSYTIAISGIFGALFGVARVLILRKSLRDPIPGPFWLWRRSAIFV